MMINKKPGLLFFLLLLLLPLSCSASNSSGKTCSYNGTSDKDNLLGVNSSLTLIEKEGNTHVVFEQLATEVAEKITVSSRREMIFSETSLDTARIKLLQDQDIYSQLVGAETTEGFVAVNQVLTCN